MSDRQLVAVLDTATAVATFAIVVLLVFAAFS